MAKCEICGKTPSFGHSVSHSNLKTKRMWRPNIQKFIIFKDGQPQRIQVCTRCLRTLNKS
jgi:large subunit ribosomal protein L28